MALTRYDVLKKALDLAAHNLYCDSANMLMSKPRPGREERWQAAVEECAILEEMLTELQVPKEVYIDHGRSDTADIEQMVSEFEKLMRKAGR